MRWGLIFWLSMFGLAMALGTVALISSRLGVPLWIAIFREEVRSPPNARSTVSELCENHRQTPVITCRDQPSRRPGCAPVTHTCAASQRACHD